MKKIYAFVAGYVVCVLFFEFLFRLEAFLSKFQKVDTDGRKR